MKQYHTRNRSGPAHRPRMPSGNLDDEDLKPSDSASNAPGPRLSAATSRSTLNTQKSTIEYRREKTNVTTKETLHTKRAPVKIETAPPPEVVNGSNGVHPKEKEKKKTVPWNPQASLKEHSTAPLASRISLPPLASNIPEGLHPVQIKSFSPEEQETQIMEDLLFAFMGYEGQFIRYSSSYNPTEEKELLAGPQWVVQPGLDTSLRALTTSMLEIATHYVAVEAFVETLSRQEFGTVNHALCASIRKLLREYLVLIAQVEHKLLTDESFTLHKLHLCVQPSGEMMHQLFALAHEMLRKNDMLDEEESDDDDDDVDKIIEQLKENKGGLDLGGTKKILKGGNVLRLITERLSHMSGNPSARRLLEGLLRDASKPYMVMLNEWLHHGSIKDPHEEFVVRELRSIKRDRLEEDFTDQFWEKRYTIRENAVPPQLEGVKDKVLLAGKYLNVVRECGGINVSKEIVDVPTTFDDPRFLHNVGSAYAHANASLLKLLLTTHELSARLQSLRHYFFLNRGDFFSYFLYLSNSELKKPAREVNVGKLQSLLDLVLRQPGSVAAQDPFKEDVRIHMNERNLTSFLITVVNVRGLEEGFEEELLSRTPAAAANEADEAAKMTGFDALEFKYSVPFPLSLVISSKTIVRYQIIFRYLLSMRHLENLIVNCWEDHIKTLSWNNRSGDRRLEMWKRRAWTLRARMLNFVQQFIYYCTVEVLEHNWKQLIAKVNARKDGDLVEGTVDELMEEHVDFLDTSLKECMLLNPKLLKIRDKLVNCCTYFAAYTRTITRNLCAADNSLAGTKPAMEFLESLYPNPRHPVPAALKQFDPEALPKMIENLEKYEDNFNRHIKILLDALDYFAATDNMRLSRLCASLSLASEKGGEQRAV